MVKSEFLNLSCYKIMFMLGIIDVCCIFCNATIYGYLSVIGAIYCTHPILIYVVGSISLSLWCGACASCMLLAVNRCLDLIKPDFARALFLGKKTYIALIIPACYMVYFMWFTNPLIYNSLYYATFFDPFVGLPEKGYSVDAVTYPHIEHTVNNLLVMTVLISSYTTLCVTVTIKGRGTSSLRLSQMQRQTFIQSSIICLFNMTAASIYASFF